MLLAILVSGATARRFSEVSLYSFVPGNWTQTAANGTSEIIIQETVPKSTFKGFVNGTQLIIHVLDNKTAKVSYGKHSYVLKFAYMGEGISISDIEIEDGNHLSITIYSTYSFELSIASHNDIVSYGFNKITKFEYKLVDFLIPTTIGIGFYFLFYKFAKKHMN